MKRRARIESVEAQRKIPPSTVAFSLLLIVGTLLLYSPLREHDFINYDDPEYVLNNPHVTAGLSWQTVWWSLTSADQANWHPLTWLSHSADYQLFGRDAGDHHLMSAAIHTLNALLLFFLLQQATGAAAPSFMVAALFAWHPFNVQSVAWVAERKNVLSTLFFLLTLAAYGWYARRPRRKSFAVVIGFFILALASKPMAVSLPFALLLLDYWPLQRVSGWIKPSSQSSIPQQPISHLLLEKWPLFVLALASSAVTIWAQRLGGAMRRLRTFPLGVRLENAAYSYVVYLCKTFWPSGFALFYPHPGNSLGVWRPAASALLLCAISAALWRQRKTRPYLIVGWLWFLGTLFPVIGIVQVGDQAMADRYAYLPTIGLFVMATWGALEVFDRLHVRAAIRWASALIVLVTLSFLTFRQLQYWQDSVAIWSHTLNVTKRNSQAERKLALAFTALGENTQALPHFINAVKFDPTDLASRVTLGAFYASEGQLQDGIQELETAVKLTDGERLNADDRKYRCSALLNLGFAQIILKDYAKALTSFQKANQTEPADVDEAIHTFNRFLATRPTEDNYLRLSLLLSSQGKDREASSLLEDAIKANPDYIDARALLNFLNSRR